MRKYFIFIIFSLILGCESDENIENKKTVIWRPDPLAIISENKVEIKWLNKTIYYKINRPYEIVHPSKFDIYISSENSSNFTKLIELTNDGEYSYTVSNLKNNTAYYFYVVSKKKGYKSLISDTIVAMPNTRPATLDIISAEEPHTNTNISLGLKKDKIAYVDKHYEWDGGENCCISIAIFISNLDGSKADLFKIKSKSPDWSPTNDTLIFSTTYGETNQGQGIFNQLAIYDIKNQQLEKLTKESYGHYSPVFSKDGKKILYESTKDSPDYHGSLMIWLLNLETLEQNKAVELLSNNLIDAKSPNWINNNEFLFQGKNVDYTVNIFKKSLHSNKIEPIIESPWDDCNPSISPDKKRIAFISNRSGRNEVWLYNLENKSYMQLTGYLEEESISEAWNKMEWLDNSSLMFNIEENRLVKLDLE